MTRDLLNSGQLPLISRQNSGPSRHFMGRAWQALLCFGGPACHQQLVVHGQSHMAGCPHSQLAVRGGASSYLVSSPSSGPNPFPALETASSFWGASIFFSISSFFPMNFTSIAQFCSQCQISQIFSKI